MAMRLVASCATLAVSAVGGDELHFLVMGDWGGKESSPYTTPGEVSTAKAMDSAAADLDANFSLVLGDNFYSHGIKSDWTDSRFQHTFEECFVGDSLSNSSGFKFHVVAGNHDHRGNVQAQIDYSSHSARWNFPNLYHSLSKTAPDGATVDIVLIDTVQLSGNSQLNDEDTDSLRGSELPGPADSLAAANQLEWLDATLKASTADYLIVGGHYPVFSIAEHGPTNSLQPSRFPYLRDNRVSAYICGHEHNEQHIDVGDGTQYHIIGSAHLADKSTAHKSTIKSIS
jgi:tartrate-resistant acid phosphatase type 5